MEAGCIDEGGELVDVVTGWLHGTAHDYACELKYCALHRDGTGRRVGEQIEQLWAALKGTSQIARYMTLANREEALEGALWLLTEQKRADFAERIKQRYIDVEKLVGMDHFLNDMQICTCNVTF